MFADEVEHLGPYIDRGTAARDELAHLAWVLHRQYKELEQGNDNALAGYAIDQFDFHAVSPMPCCISSTLRRSAAAATPA